MAKWPNIDCTDEIHQVTKKEKQEKKKAKQKPVLSFLVLNVGVIDLKLIACLMMVAILNDVIGS